MRTKKTTKPAPNLAASSNGDSKPERTTKLLTTNGKAGENEEDPADSVILIDNDSLVSIAENGNVEKADGSESEKDDEATSSHKANDKAGSADDKTDSGTKEPTKIIRLVSIEKLMRPNLLPTTEEETSKKKSSHKKTTIEKLSNKRAKDTSVIEISDTDNEDDNKPLFKKIKTDGDVVQNLFIDDSDDEIISIKKKVFPKATKASKKLIDDDEDEEEDYQPVVKGQLIPKAAKSKPKQHAKVPEGCKSFSLRVEKLPSDLKSFMKEHKLSGILDRKNREITTFKPNTNHYGDFIRKRNASGAGSSKSKAQDGKKSMSSKSLVILSSESEEANSDEPIANMVSKSDNIPKNKTMSKRSTRSKRQLNGSDDDGDSDGDFEIKTGKSKATVHERSRRQREMRQARRRKDSSEEEEEDEEENDKAGGSESDDFEEDKPQPKKKRSRIKKVSSSSSDDDDGNKKRRKRIKKSSESDGEDDSPSKGRKNIRKLLKKSALEQTTKEAEQEEKDRKQRIADRQKLYNQVYDEKPEEVKEINQLVLDFDEETKEPLLEVDRNLVKKLKPHQANGIKFMFDACFESLEMARNSKGSGCILAHCMGLGKTLQVVALAHTLLVNSEVTGVERILVVCPLSTVLNWVNEFRIWMRHVKKGTDVEIYEISKYKNNVIRANQLMEWHNEGGVMILGYDMFRNLSNQTTGRIRKKVRESLRTSLVDPGPDMIICDEGHLLKNEKTSLSKAVNQIKTLRRIVLTGTPIQNNMKEYYCMVHFVKPKLLGTYNEYMNRFVNPITNGQYTDSTPYDIQLMRRRAHVLHKLLDGCVQRRDYAVLAPFLPPKLEFVVSIKLTPLQCTLYKYYMETQARKQQGNDESKRSSVLFSDFQNLQRIWTHPRVLRYNSDRYEYMQQKKRDMMSDEDSVGSIKDFLDDDDSEQEDTSESESESGGGSDDSHKKKNKKEEQTLASVAAAARRTRNNPNVEEEDLPVIVEQKNENPTEWWMSMVPEEELDNLEHSGKLQVLFEILKECEAIGDKLLVFSQSLYALDVIEHFLALVDENTQKDEDERDTELDKYQGSWTQGLDYFRLDGSTAIENRNSACKIFNDESNHRARLFLISTRAGGLGINLVAANRVVIFDVSWNPSHDIQSIFRVYRFGQNKPCYVYRFLAMGTMEEKIYERQVTKQAISKRVIDEQQIDRHYKENDLQELYRYDNIEPEEARPTPNLPKDRLFAELLKKFDVLLYKYHEHDSLLENKEEETLNEEERKAAWDEFEQEKNRPPVTNYGMGNAAYGMGMNMGMGRAMNGPVTSSSIFGFRNDVLLKLLNMKARHDNPSFNEANIASMIPFLMQELCRQMKDGDLSMYKSLLELYYQLEAPNPYTGMSYNPMMMQQPQQAPPMMQQQHHQIPQPVIMPSSVGGGGMMDANAANYSMEQIRFLRQQEQQRYSQMNEASSSGLNRGSIITAAQKRFMTDPEEIVELD
ncbi:transcriptional regulator ATRX homolog [Ochlerotatus camptorhynchus]|uniref:transcriptional regulator ATRX homolog n=1 Tax=Ochlerotatus camptorhynchus TaxID=644619 RepID=UPI0031D7DFE5